MKSILLIAACIVAMGFAVASCRFAPSPKLGDTVASSVSAEINNVVRVKYYLLNGKDSLVKEVEQVEFS